MAKLFVTRVFHYNNLSCKIISDQVPWFASKFTKEVCKILGIQQSISNTYHPRTAGQSECTNQRLKTYLQLFVSCQQDDWVSYLHLVEFARNNWKNTTTRKSLFHLLMGYHPHADWDDTPSALPQVSRHLNQLQSTQDQAQEAMTKAQNLWVKHQTPWSIRRVTSCHWKDTISTQISQWPNWQHDTTDLFWQPRWCPCHLSIDSSHEVKHTVHPVFHIDLLTPYHDPLLRGKNYTCPPPDLIIEAEEYEVEWILDMWHVGRRKKHQYLVKWKGYPELDNEWVDHRGYVSWQGNKWVWRTDWNSQTV